MAAAAIADTAITAIHVALVRIAPYSAGERQKARVASYRATHPTFEAYCRERWGFTASRARQMIRAAKTVTAGNASARTERKIRRAISAPARARQDEG